LETDVQLEQTYKDKANLENMLATCQEENDSLSQRMMEEEEVHQVN
jgi:bacterioferritin (cytochrome b1)